MRSHHAGQINPEPDCCKFGLPMIRQSIDPLSCSTAPFRDLTWPRATIFSKRSASRSKSFAAINRACQMVGLPARSANSRYQPASSRSLRGSSMTLSWCESASGCALPPKGYSSPISTTAGSSRYCRAGPCRRWICERHSRRAAAPARKREPSPPSSRISYARPNSGSNPPVRRNVSLASDAATISIADFSYGSDWPQVGRPYLRIIRI